MTTPYGTTGFVMSYPPTNAGYYRMSNALQFLFPDGTTSLIVNVMAANTNTYFWDREAMAQYPSDAYDTLFYNLGTATPLHCTMTTRWCITVSYGAECAVPYVDHASVKNTITYAYPGGTPEPGYPQYYYIGTTNKPSSITRTVSGSTTQTWQYTYNFLEQYNSSH